MFLDVNSDGSEERVRGTRFGRRRRRGLKKAKKFKSIMEPSSEEGPLQQVELDHVGMQVKMPKFGGRSGLEVITSKLIRNLSMRAENIEEARAAV